jgi:tetratricopeptide (TPR) repeat protein
MAALAITWWNAMRADRPREALAALAQVDVERPPVRDYPAYWDVLTQSRHQLGDYRAELAAAERGRRLHPSHTPIVYAEARALAALGRAADAERRLGEVLDLAPDPVYTVGELMVALGRELRAHGHEAAARSTFARAIEWYDARPDSARASPALRGRRGEALYCRGAAGTRRAGLFEQLAAERRGESSRVGDLGTLGLSPVARWTTAATSARSPPGAATGWRHSPATARWPPAGQYLLGRHTYWRARIAALLGERERAVALLRDALQQGRTHVVDARGGGLRGAARPAGVPGARPTQGVRPEVSRPGVTACLRCTPGRFAPAAEGERSLPGVPREAVDAHVAVHRAHADERLPGA